MNVMPHAPSTAVPPPRGEMDETSTTHVCLEKPTLGPTTAAAAGPSSTATRPLDSQLFKSDERIWAIVPATALSIILSTQRLDLTHPHFVWTGRTVQYLTPSATTPSVPNHLYGGGGEPLVSYRPIPTTTTLAETRPFFQHPNRVSVPTTTKAPSLYEKPVVVVPTTLRHNLQR